MEEKAFGIAKVDGKYNVVEVTYNAETGEAKVTNKTPANTLSETVEQFKIDVGRARMFNPRD